LRPLKGLRRLFAHVHAPNMGISKARRLGQDSRTGEFLGKKEAPSGMEWAEHRKVLLAWIEKNPALATDIIDAAYLAGLEADMNGHSKALRAELVAQIEGMPFRMNVDEYLPLVKRWDKKNYDTPFNDGFERAKLDAIRIIRGEDNV